MAFTTTIHSIGDAAFLSQILNSVSMVVGTNDYTRLVSIGLLLGVLVVVIQGLFRGAREIPWQQLLLGWIIYACMFVPTTTVVIEDSYTGKTRTVDNVPLGVAFSGAMISNIGYGITVLFETAYHDVSSVTDRSFAEPLRLTNALRQHSADIAILNELDKQIGANTDIAKSLRNYIKDCSMPKLTLGVTSPTNMVTQNALDEIRFNSHIYGTKIFIRNARGEDLTCQEAWVKLLPELEKVREPKFIKGLSDAANLKSIDPNAGGNRSADINDYQQAFDMLNISSTQVEHYILTSLIKPIYENASAGFYRNVGDSASAIMINQAIQQRNTQWSAEASMFATVVRPLLTFFEGFMYGITPVIGFLLVMGGIGMSLAMKYIMLILWIQLWMPVMSIVNLYVIMAARGEIAGNIQTYESFYAIDKIGNIIEHWLATGGMLAAATPLISLFLVSGSVYAFTSLTQRMNGGDHINEKIPTPDAVQPGAFYQQQPAGSGSSLLGAQRTGAEGTEGSVNISDLKSSAVASSRTEKEAASNGLSETLQTSWSTGNGTSQTASLERKLGESIKAENSEVYARAKQAIKGSSWGKNLSDTQTNEMIGAWSAMASAGWSPSDIAGGLVKKLTGADVSARSSYQTSDQERDSFAKTLSKEEQDSISKTINSSDSSSLAKAFDSALSKSDTEQFLTNANVSENSSVGQAFSSSVEKAKNYQETQTAMNSVGFSGNYTTRQLGAMLKTAEGNVALGQMATAYQGTAIEQEANGISNRLQRFNNVDAETARAVGLITALARSGDSNHHADFAKLMQTATGLSTDSVNGAGAHAGIADNVVNPSSEGMGSKDEVRATAGMAANSVAERQRAIGQELDSGKAMVTEKSEEIRSGVKARGEAGDAVDQAEAVSEARAGLARTVDERAGAPKPVAMSDKETMYNKAVEAGLTNTQAEYMTNALLGDHYNKKIGRKELFEENKALYGHSMSDKEIQSLTNDMVKHFDNASWGGANNFTNYLGPVTAWNQANTKFGKDIK